MNFSYGSARARNPCFQVHLLIERRKKRGTAIIGTAIYSMSDAIERHESVHAEGKLGDARNRRSGRAISLSASSHNCVSSFSTQRPSFAAKRGARTLLRGRNEAGA